MSMGFIIGGFFIGLIVGIVGAILNWSPIRVFVTAAVFGLAWGALARADDSAAFAILRDTTVHISVGTGSIVQGDSGKQYILTNSHVCNYARWNGTLTAHYQDGTPVTGIIAKDNFAIDLCAARISRQNKALKLGPRLLPLSRVYTRGYPGHILSQSSGVVGLTEDWMLMIPIEELGKCPAGTREVLDLRDVVFACHAKFRSTLSTLYGRPGSSGSPVVNSAGELVGVVSSVHTDTAYSTGMVTFQDLQKFMQGL